MSVLRKALLGGFVIGASQNVPTVNFKFFTGEGGGKGPSLAGIAYHTPGNRTQTQVPVVPKLPPEKQTG